MFWQLSEMTEILKHKWYINHMMSENVSHGSAGSVFQVTTQLPRRQKPQTQSSTTQRVCHLQKETGSKHSRTFQQTAAFVWTLLSARFVSFPLSVSFRGNTIMQSVVLGGGGWGEFNFFKMNFSKRIDYKQTQN